MAEGFLMEGKSLEELESEITCGICQEHYTEPKILPCLHYYCKQCILSLAQRSATGKPFYCPECRCAATLPEGGVDQLKTAFFINRLKSKVTTMKQIDGKVEVKCELCSESASKAVAYCQHCSMFICSQCVMLHTKIQTFKTHKVASLDDLKHGRAQLTAIKEPPPETCKHHEQESLTLFCFDCDCLICQHCTMKAHREHKFDFSQKVAADAKADLLEEVKPIIYLQKNLNRIADDGQITVSEVCAQKESIINAIHASFEKLRTILGNREKELVEEVNAVSEDKVKQLMGQSNTMYQASAEVQSVVEYTERCVSLSTDSEVMSMRKELRKTMAQKVIKHGNKTSSVPVEVADLVVEMSCIDAIEQLCQTKAVISKLLIDPVKCTVNLPEHAEVGKPSTAILITRLSNNKQAKRNCKISSQIKSLHNGVITDCNIDEHGSGRYSIQCTPTVRGRHELTVLIDGQHVAGSPFPVYVSIDPKQLGRPVKYYSSRSPLAITANTKGEILVTEKQENIFKFTSRGEKTKLIAVHELETLSGIACDDEDNIYCIDDKTNKIFTCDQNGRNGKVQSIEMEGSRGRSALLVANNHLMVAELCLKGTIKVYNRDLQYIRAIRHNTIGTISGLATDLHGNIYATDSGNSCIQVLDSNGTLTRSIGRDKRELQNPWGVCVSGQYVYVTDADSVCVFVFTTDGEYVTSFGQPGNSRGDFSCPTHMYADEHGFVYVCDLINNTIQCF